MATTTLTTRLEDLDQLLDTANLEADTAEAIGGYLDMIRLQLTKPKPNQTVIQTNLNGIADRLANNGWLGIPGYRCRRCGQPITNGQYRPFVDSGGYEQPQWWSAAGLAWRQGAEADLSAIDDEDLKKQVADWLAQRPQEKRHRPFYSGGKDCSRQDVKAQSQYWC
jgi:hypothetical protein